LIIHNQNAGHVRNDSTDKTATNNHTVKHEYSDKIATD
jgi:hypothetical protein